VCSYLKLLLLKGAIVTLDAMGCQRNIAAQIKSQEADYILAVKKNQKGLYQEIAYLFTVAEGVNYEPMQCSKHETQENQHGRIDKRCYAVLPSAYLKQLKSDWQGIQTIIQVKSQRENKGEAVKTEKRYYISSLPLNAQLISHAIRAHWRIENNLHWSLDVSFREDESRIRKAYAPENVGWLRRFALTLLKKETSFRASIARKRFKALMNNDYLMSVIHAN
jgi:predicted transposase YbfD/YdcC